MSSSQSRYMYITGMLNYALEVEVLVFLSLKILLFALIIVLGLYDAVI